VIEPWTPGPWWAESKPNGWHVYHNRHWHPALEREVGDDVLLDGPDLHHDGANARLIALAPEMADLLKRWVGGKKDKSIFSDTAAVLVRAGL
jgi:hypothetical protein